MTQAKPDPRAQAALADLNDALAYFTPDDLPRMRVNDLLLHRERGAYLPYFDLR